MFRRWAEIQKPERWQIAISSVCIAESSISLNSEKHSPKVRGNNRRLNIMWKNNLLFLSTIKLSSRVRKFTLSFLHSNFFVKLNALLALG